MSSLTNLRNPLLQVAVVAGVGFGHPISSRQARFIVLWLGQERPCSDARLWAGAVINDSEHMSLYFCPVQPVLLFNRFLSYKESRDGTL